MFDLLNTLPLDEFGLMAWAIVDREEELFEMEDVRDEDKVMLALWNRWIMLNKCARVTLISPLCLRCADWLFRVDFMFHDYFEGVKKFIDKYWRMIHLAAGWRALRAFLIVSELTLGLS